MTDAPPPSPGPSEGDTAPLSRREAREAAERAQRASERTASEPVTAPVPRPPARPAGFDDLFVPEEPMRHVTPAKPAKKRGPGRWIALGIVLVLVGGVAGGGVWAWNAYGDKIRAVFGWQEPKDYSDGQAEGEATVTINSGDGGQAISQALFAAGVTKTASAFYDMLVGLNSTPTFYPGVYKLQQKMSAKAALAALEDPANKLDNTAQLPEGLTVDQTLQRLSSSLNIPLADLQAATAKPSDYGVSADSLEGWLFPATYTFDPGVTAPQVIQRMVDRAVQSLDAAGVPVDQRQRILTIASIIQREARVKDDFYKVSRVIQNRLADGMKLEMDSTAQYGYGELNKGSAGSSQGALDSVNAWNTYKITGLPATPIAGPGDTAIDAAMHPVDGPWLYFVTINLYTGETVFSATYDEQLAAEAKLHEWCAANPTAGCYAQ